MIIKWLYSFLKYYLRKSDVVFFVKRRIVVEFFLLVNSVWYVIFDFIILMLFLYVYYGLLFLFDFKKEDFYDLVL